MIRRAVTAHDVLALARRGASELVLEPDDRLTPLARDTARERGIRVLEPQPAAPYQSDQPARPDSGRRRQLPPLRHVPGVDRLELAPFPVDLGRPEMDVRSRDVVTSEHGMPMSAGVLSLREGSFAWTLDYDEVQYVLEGELHITRDREQVIGKPGDVIAVPKGSSITFSTPTWARFLYVTYPANWKDAP